jgi:hypothetical protein
MAKKLHANEIDDQIGDSEPKSSPVAEYQNPPHKGWVMKWFLVVFAVIIIFFIIDVFDGKFGSTLVVICGGSFLLFGIWLREYYRRPIAIKIEESGVELSFRYKRPKFVPWRDFKWLLSPPGDPKTLKEAWDRDGYLQLKNDKFYPLFWPVAIAVREAYKENYGHYPPSNEKEADMNQ